MHNKGRQAMQILEIIIARGRENIGGSGGRVSQETQSATTGERIGSAILQSLPKGADLVR